MNSIRTLQTGLAQDLVEFEGIDLDESQLELIEDSYEKVYLLLNQALKD